MRMREYCTYVDDGGAVQGVECHAVPVCNGILGGIGVEMDEIQGVEWVCEFVRMYCWVRERLRLRHACNKEVETYMQ